MERGTEQAKGAELRAEETSSEPGDKGLVRLHCMENVISE
jgi:hypothetical protein